MFARFNYNIILFVFVLCCDSCAALNKGETCVFQDGSEGKCKLMRECPIALRLIKIGVFPVICGLEGATSIVCCKDDNEVTKTTNTTSATNPVTSRIPGDISKQKCKEYAEYAYEKVPSPTLLLNPHITKRLVCDIPRNRLVEGSSLAEIREFPHMALIGYNNSDEIIWKCGGSLISENFILTITNCLFLTNKGPAILVRVGLTDKLDPTHMQERTVSEVFPYPEFDSSSGVYHDIGLLRLSKDVTFNIYARPACLHTEKSIPYLSAIASGWKAISSATNFSTDLLATVLKFYRTENCDTIYRAAATATELVKNGVLDDLMICAGISTPSGSAREKHFGGPFQVYHKESEEVKCMYDIIGVISITGSYPPLQDRLDVFTRVSAYIKWIEDIVWPN